jgi:hypothetical protein
VLSPVIRDCFWGSEQSLHVFIAAVERVCWRGLDSDVGTPGRVDARQLHDAVSVVLGVRSCRARANGHSVAKARHFDSKSVREILLDLNPVCRIVPA